MKPFTIGYAHVCDTDIGMLLILPYPGEFGRLWQPYSKRVGINETPPPQKLGTSLWTSQYMLGPSRVS